MSGIIAFVIILIGLLLVAVGGYGFVKGNGGVSKNLIKILVGVVLIAIGSTPTIAKSFGETVSATAQTGADTISATLDEKSGTEAEL